MLQFSTGTRQQLPPQLFEQMGHYRREVFINRLGWELNTINGMELDEFDGPAVYVSSHDDAGNVNGVARLLPTTGSYLMEKVFPQLWAGNKLPRDPQIWELSRFAMVENAKSEGQYQINVNQIRVIANTDFKGVTVPEGPHRDGHEFSVIAIADRHNVCGGETQVIEPSTGQVIFRKTLDVNQAIIIDDERYIHYATNIEPEQGDVGHRDIWVIEINRWDQRANGPRHERQASEARFTEENTA
jgi:hypothetical protein